MSAVLPVYIRFHREVIKRGDNVSETSEVHLIRTCHRAEVIRLKYRESISKTSTMQPTSTWYCGLVIQSECGDIKYLRNVCSTSHLYMVP
jgi:hypothetical protein